MELPLERPAGAASLAEAEAFLEAHPEVKQVELLLTDISGVARGKLLRREELAPIYRNGRPLPGTILALDITGADVEEAGLLWTDGDADRLAWPAPGTLLPAPWFATPGAQVIATMHELDGQPFHPDPRQALAAVVRRFAALEMVPVAALELEFYLLDAAAVAEGRILPPRGQRSGQRLQQLQAYALDELEDFAPLLDEIYAGAAAMELPARTLISEYAPGQFEIVLGHRADALKAADEAVAYKRLVKGVALRHGYLATFMAKPYAQVAGSGLHIHVSLADGAGANRFAGIKDESPLLRRVIAGLMASLPDCAAFLAPNANSYRRFRSGSYAPTKATWGFNNRSVALRVTAGPPSTRHLECRVAGADANPYLALAVTLAAMHRGLVEDFALAPAVTGNGYLADGQALPTDWRLALERAAAAPWLADYLGEDFLRVFLSIKTAELERFHAEVSDVDRAWYLRQA